MQKDNRAVELTSFLEFNSVMTPPRISSGSRLKPLFDSLASRDAVSKPRSMLPTDHFWTAQRYGLENCSIFAGLSEEKQSLALGEVTRHILHQGAAIECAGISYAGKMILLSETLEEKSLYAGIAADEAGHLREFENFAGTDHDDVAHPANPFLQAVHAGVQLGSRSVCHAFLQVLLEGFGMHFYNDLKNDCTDPELRSVLVRILKDEAIHHGSGLVLSESAGLTEGEQDGFRFLLDAFTKSAQLWALPLVQAVENVTGHLSRAQKRTVLTAVATQEKAATRLTGMRALLGNGRLLAYAGEAWVSGLPAALSADQVLDCL